MKIIDAHIHIFSKINGANAMGAVIGCEYGKILNAGTRSAFMPPYTEKTLYNAEMILETMNQNGIDKAVLLQNPTIGNVNEEIGEAILKYSGRLAGVLQVDPFAADAVQKVEQCLTRYPYCAIKLELSTGWGWTGIYEKTEFHYDMLKPLIEVAFAHKLTVIFDTGDTNSRAYLPKELCKLAECFPNVPFVIEHGGYMTPDGDRKKWEAMTDLVKIPNIYFGICAMGSLLEEEYPCKKSLELLRQLYDKAGAEKLLWGTDAPCTLKSYTYKQMIDSIVKYADFLSEEDLKKIFYDNAEKLFF